MTSESEGMSPEDKLIARLKKALSRIAAVPRTPGDSGLAQKIAREALRDKQ